MLTENIPGSSTIRIVETGRELAATEHPAKKVVKGTRSPSSWVCRSITETERKKCSRRLRIVDPKFQLIKPALARLPIVTPPVHLRDLGLRVLDGLLQGADVAVTVAPGRKSLERLLLGGGRGS